MILGCDFCDKDVEEIRPRALTVELDDGTTIQIVLKPSPGTQDAPPLHEDQGLIPRHKSVSPKLQTVIHVVFQNDSKTWVQVKTKQKGLILVTPTRQTYENKFFLAATGVAQVKPDEPFRILVAKCGKRSKILLQNQHRTDAEDSKTALIESDVTHPELLGIINEGETTPTNYKMSTNENTYYRKINLNIRDEKIINRHITDIREEHMEKDERPRQTMTFP